MTTRHIPIVINSYNQPAYLRRMVVQLVDRGYENLLILDQASTYPPLLEMLETLERRFTVLRMARNNGPHWLFTSGFCAKLPVHFVYTDADLQFSDALGPLFIDEMLEVCMELSACKLGMALDVSRPDAMRNFNINISGKSYTLVEWEKQFWTRRMTMKGGHEVYRAPVDTTFAIYNRTVFDAYLRRFYETKVFDCMSVPNSFRIAGDFTCVHLPWMKDTLTSREEEEYYAASRLNIHKY
jgi:glycosyltransferase involved in cell wall biosynthesis